MVIGEVTFGQLANAVYDAQLTLAREINPKVMSRSEWTDKKNAQNVFVQPFVVNTVLPLLGQAPGAQCSRQELKERLLQWLCQFANQSPTICFDYQGDWQLLCAALWVFRSIVTGDSGLS